MVCRAQLPLLVQVAHWQSCSERISCTFVLRDSRTLGLLVRISMPSFTSVLQAERSLSMPATSTTQIRQAPISFSPSQ